MEHRIVEPSKLNRLSDINSNNGINFLQRGLSPGSHCPMHTSLALIRRMKGLSTLVVGMPECSYYSRYVMDKPMDEEGAIHYTYVLDENEVVFGCRNGLIEAIKEMEKDGAKDIAIIMTCIPELIGEDIESIIFELQYDSNITVLPIVIPHFKYNGYQAGYVNTLKSLYHLMKNNEREREKVINILGEASGNDFYLVLQKLEVMGYQIVNLGSSVSLHNVRNTTNASLNLVTSQYFTELAKLMKSEFNIPYIDLYHKYGANEILDSYNNIFSILNKEANTNEGFNPEEDSLINEKIIYNLVVDINEKEHFIINNHNHTKYISVDAYMDPISLGAYLTGIGLEPELLHIEEYYSEDDSYKEELLIKEYNPYVCYISDKSELIEISDLLESTISIGSSGINVLKDVNIESLYRKIGLERTFELLKVLESKLLPVEQKGE